MKKFLKISLTSVFIILLAIATLNYLIDPYWCFSHSNIYNQYQKGSNERQQKTNYIYFTNKKYDTLLLGSSRITYFNKNLLNGNVFNYACSDMQPKEYKSFIQFAIKKAKQPIKTIYIGLDFYGSLTYSHKKYNNTNVYFNNTLSSLYREKLLFSIDALNISAHNIKNYLHKKESGTYNRNNIKSSVTNFNNIKNNNSKKFNTTFMKRYKYGSFKHDKYYINYLKELKTSFPNIKFVIFTTPISKKLLEYIVTTNRYKYYEQWLIETTKIFGKINHLMYLNEITVQNKYFMDSNHAYPDYYKKVATLLNSNISSDNNMCMVITRKNLNEKLKLLRKFNKCNTK